MSRQFFELASVPDLFLSQYRDLYSSPVAGATDALYRAFALSAHNDLKLSLIYDVDPGRVGKKRARAFVCIESSAPRLQVLSSDPFLRNFVPVERNFYHHANRFGLHRWPVTVSARGSEMLVPWRGADEGVLHLDDLFAAIEHPLIFAVTLSRSSSSVVTEVLKASHIRLRQMNEPGSSEDGVRTRESFEELLRELTTPPMADFNLCASSNDPRTAKSFLRSYASCVLGTHCYRIEKSDAPADMKHPLRSLMSIVGPNESRLLLQLPPFGNVGHDLKTFELETERRIENGEVLEIGMDTRFDSPVTVNLHNLTRHAFITGMTGSGKTRSMVRVLEGLQARGIPWLVIEPAKSEYVELLTERGISVERFAPGRPRAFRCDDEWGGQMFVDPFYRSPGVDIDELIGSLVDVFRAVFPIDPQNPFHLLLERGLYRMFDHPKATGSLSSLLMKSIEAVASAAYDGEVGANLKAMFRARLESLQEGIAGRLFNEGISYPAPFQLLQSLTVLELDGLSREGAALVTLLLCAQLRQLLGHLPRPEGSELRFALVLEEAHRLVPKNPNDDGASAFAAEYLSNLLAEIRAYGVGVLVVDQAASAVARNVVSNTGLKIAHRIVNKDDRDIMAASMLLSDDSAMDLGSLLPGQSWIFASEHARPMFCDGRVPVERGVAGSPPSGRWLARAEQRANWRRASRRFVFETRAKALTASDEEYNRLRGESLALLEATQPCFRSAMSTHIVRLFTHLDRRRQCAKEKLGS